MNLSPTKLSALTKCPYSFKLQYVNNLRLVKDSANLRFGQAIHDAVEASIMGKGSAYDVFAKAWAEYHDVDLQYSSKEDWGSMAEKGATLTQDFDKNYRARFINPYSLEGEISYDLDPQTRLYGKTDYVGDFVTDDGEVVKAIVDFKTSASKYSDDKIKFNEQLTAYSKGAKMYPFEIEKVVLFVFVKTKAPYIQVIVEDKRSEQEIKDFMDTTLFFLDNIYRGRYPKMKGDHCGWCDYCSVCTYDVEAMRNELMVQIRKYNSFSQVYDTLHELRPGQFNVLKIDGDDRPMLEVSRFLKEYDIPNIDMGFEVQRDGRSFYYWWSNGKLSRIKKPLQGVA